MKVYRVWRTLNLRTGETIGIWNQRTARTAMAESAIRRAGEPTWQPIDPYSFQTAVQVEVLGWGLRTPWKTLLSVPDPN